MCFWEVNRSCEAKNAILFTFFSARLAETNDFSKKFTTQTFLRKFFNRKKDQTPSLYGFYYI